MDSTFDESIASAHCPEAILTSHKQVLDLAPAISSWFSLATALALNQGRRLTMLILAIRTLNITSYGTSRNMAIPQVAEMYRCL